MSAHSEQAARGAAVGSSPFSLRPSVPRQSASPSSALASATAKHGVRRAATAAVLPTRAAWVLLGTLYAAAGGLVISTTFVESAAPDRHAWVVRAMDGCALACAAVLLLLARRLPRRALGPVISMSSVLIAICVLASGGQSTAVAYACVFFVGPVYARFVLRPREADLQLLLVFALGVPTLAVQVGVTVGEQAIVWGITLMQSAAVRWLVAALQKAETDALTGLPNHRGVERVLSDALVGAHDGSVGLVVVQLHGVLGARSGGAAGDDGALLAAVARWREVLPPQAVLGRLSASVFSVVVRECTLPQVTRLARELVAASPPTLRTRAATAAWERGEDTSTLLARAESASLTAVRSGSDPVYEHPGTGREGLELRRALDEEQFVVHFQPIVDLESGVTVGAEALIRWQHPERGLLMPGAFLDDVERCDLFRRLGEWMIAAATEQAASWPANALGDLPYLSVNASGPELLDPGYAGVVERALMTSGLAPERLVVELVESAYDATSAVVAENLIALRAMGIRTAIDDFGVGHSSLERLRQTGGALLKIDKSFVQDITTADQDAPLVLAVIALGEALGMRVIAEGVETAEQAHWLRSRGCALAQGWRFSPARPDEAFTASLRDTYAATLATHTE